MGQPAVRLEIAISVLADGRVVFCDLPPDLAQVRDVLAGDVSPCGTGSTARASEPIAADPAGSDTGECPA